MVMIPTDVGVQLRTQAEVGAHPLRPIAEIGSDLPELQPGQPFRARIQEALPENTYKAVVAGRLMTLSLPEGAKAGDTLDLVVVSRSLQGIVAQRGNAAEGAEVAPFANASLSRAGQLIASLLGAEGETPPPADLTRGGPVLARVPVNGAEIARELPPNLARAVAGSGMFYEAHQVQWALGQRPLASLLSEPQGRFSNPAVLLAVAAGDEESALAARGESTAATPSPRDLQQALVARSPVIAGIVDSAQAGQPAAIPDELRQLVQQQLEAGASNRLVWQGEVWPNQVMDWEIRRDSSGSAETPEPQDIWQTRLRLILPRLGEIDVRLQLSGASVNLMLEASAPASGARLEAAIPGLQQSFDAAGLVLAGAQVKREPV